MFSSCRNLTLSYENKSTCSLIERKLNVVGEKKLELNWSTLLKKLQMIFSMYKNFSISKIRNVSWFKVQSSLLNKVIETGINNVNTLTSLQGLTNLIFACTDFSACKMVRRARSYTQNYVSVKHWQWALIYIV